MRTTLDLPDDILRQAKIVAVHRGSSLRQLVIDALKHEMQSASPQRKRLTRAPVKLSADAPLRKLTAAEVKNIDAEDMVQADAKKNRALPR